MLPAMAQEIMFYVSVPNIVAFGDRYQIKFILTGSNVGEAFSAPDLGTLEVLFGPKSTPYPIQKINDNGRMVRKERLEVVYTLLAKKEGSFNIPSASIRVAGKTYRSAPKTFRIEKAESLQGASLESSRTSEKLPPSDMFLRAVTSKNRVYEQEPVLINLYLYSRHANINVVNRTPPEVADFITQELTGSPQQQLTTENWNGRLYYKALVWQMLAYPQKSGRLMIPSFGYDFEVLVPVKAKDEKDHFSSRGLKRFNKSLRCQDITINVDPLPAGKPSNFSGLVGRFSISDSLGAPEGFRTGHSIVYSLTIKGEGNANRITTPEIEFPSVFETYTPEERELESQLSSKGITTGRSFKYILIPRNAGTYTIPSVELSYFDPNDRAYKLLSTRSHEVKIKVGESLGASVVSNEKGTDKNKADAPAPLKRGNKLNKTFSIFSGGVAYYSLYCFTLISFVLLLMGYRIILKRRANIQEFSASRAFRIAEKKLKKAKELVHESEEELYKALLETFYSYISDRFSIPVVHLNRSDLEQEFRVCGVNSELIVQSIAWIDQVELLSYAPSTSHCDTQDLYNRCAALIIALEASVKTEIV